MAPTLEQVMNGVEARLNTINGLRVAAFVQDQINPPQAMVHVPTVPDYHATMGRGRIVLEVTVTVFAGAGVDRAGQLALAAFANPTGAQSVVAAIEADRKLGGAVEDCIVTGFRPLGLEDVGAIGYYGGEFTLRVVASGT